MNKQLGGGNEVDRWSVAHTTLLPNQCTSINLVSKSIYHQIDGILLKSFKFGQRQLVIKNQPGVLSQSETMKYFERIIIIIIIQARQSKLFNYALTEMKKKYIKL